jgi:hypothetical protein
MYKYQELWNAAFPNGYDGSAWTNLTSTLTYNVKFAQEQPEGNMSRCVSANSYLSEWIGSLRPQVQDFLE